MGITKDILFNLYVEENKSSTEIAKIFGYKTSKSIADKLKEFNIPIRQKNEMSKRIGMRNLNKHGSEMEIIEYNNVKDIWVKFLDNGNLVHTGYGAFCRGGVKNSYNKTIFGIGFLGVGEYKMKENRLTTPQYSCWYDMLSRCYSKKCQEINSSYQECTVADEWHNLQNFAKWYDENYYEIKGERIHLDKDILIKGNKIYSHETCLFVPQRINNLIVKSDSTRGEYPIGVHFEKQTNKYKAQCRDNKGKTKNLGRYETLEEAFNIYKIFKEKVIKQVAEEYKDKIPEKLYDALLNYQVEITD
jgi:hypothetical protein